MKKMKLDRFRIYNFKSIRDSGWIQCEDITTLVGVNEAGKSNILLALWKFNPANGEKIKFSDDMPVSKFSEFRNLSQKPKFIDVEFIIQNQKLLEKLSQEFDEDIEDIRTILISKDYDNNFSINFPKAKCKKVDISKEISYILIEFKKHIESVEEKGKKEIGLKDTIMNKISEKEDISTIIEVEELIVKLSDLLNYTIASSDISLVIKQTIELLKNLNEEARKSTINESKNNVLEIVETFIPKFVYYSNYGNLDCEIYLPTIIENMKRKDITDKTTLAKMRTLKVLFEYVGLEPKEILEMAPDKVYLDYYGNCIKEKTNEDLENQAERTKERELLLQSASSKLTREFKSWWKQGDYIFRLHADGTQLSILVSDNKRKEEISLENRSTGLQWFLSFYLVFLVESKDSHTDSILLLDEAGTSLHPLAQKDLIVFFEELSKSNQILHTTHSPFLVNPESLERAKVVYVDDDGYTVASEDLKAGIKNESALKSNYAIHAALGLSVSDVFLQGCKIVIVEGVSDQYYMNAIKTYLIKNGLIQPEKDIVFIPSGGIKGVTSLSSIFGSKDGMPTIILDSDRSGIDTKNKLIQSKGIYEGLEQKIISIGDYLTVENAEVEDLFPILLFRNPYKKVIYKYLLKHDIDIEFEDIFDNCGCSFNQALENKVNVRTLDMGYKVSLSKEIKKNLIELKDEIDNFYLQTWLKLFEAILKED